MQNLHKTLFGQQFSLQPIIVQFLHINTQADFLGQAAVMYLRFSDTMRMAIAASTSSMLVSLSSPEAMM